VTPCDEKLALMQGTNQFKEIGDLHIRSD